LQSGAAHVSTLSSTITNIHAQIGWSVILYGLGAAILIALAGSALASFFISKVMPAEVLRSE
jgi:ABC-type antimicrobial peptide transport system permease subunit